MLGQSTDPFFAVGRKYRTVDVWEFGSTGWRLIFVQQPALLLEELQARVELGNVKVQHYRISRIFRLWTWSGTRWDLTEQA